MIAAVLIATAAACSGAPLLSPSAIVSKSLGAWVGVTNRGDHAVVVCIHPPFWLVQSNTVTIPGGSPHECRSLVDKHLLLPRNTLMMKDLSAKPHDLRRAIEVSFSVTGFSLDGKESGLIIECVTRSIARNLEVQGAAESWEPLVVAGDGLSHVGLKNTAHMPRVITELRPSSGSPPRKRCASGPRYLILPGEAYFQVAVTPDIEQFDELSAKECLRAVTFDFRSVTALPRPP